MTKKYRTYSNDFKRQLIAEIEAGQISISAASRQHDISENLIRRWRDQLRTGTFRDKPSLREKQLERELEKAQAKIGELTLVVDLLKKIQKTSAPTKRSNGSVVTLENWVSPSKKDAK